MRAESFSRVTPPPVFVAGSVAPTLRRAMDRAIQLRRESHTPVCFPCVAGATSRRHSEM
jgi:hypothetical protein